MRMLVMVSVDTRHLILGLGSFLILWGLDAVTPNVPKSCLLRPAAGTRLQTWILQVADRIRSSRVLRLE